MTDIEYQETARNYEELKRLAGENASLRQQLAEAVAAHKATQAEAGKQFVAIRLLVEEAVAAERDISFKEAAAAAGLCVMGIWKSAPTEAEAICAVQDAIRARATQCGNCGHTAARHYGKVCAEADCGCENYQPAGKEGA